MGGADGSEPTIIKPTDSQVAAWYKKYHYGKWLRQLNGRNGPGSCLCCPDGGPYAGTPPPKDFTGKGQYAD